MRVFFWILFLLLAAFVTRFPSSRVIDNPNLNKKKKLVISEKIKLVVFRWHLNKSYEFDNKIPIFYSILSDYFNIKIKVKITY